MTNPFKFGDPVEGDFYLPRPQLSHVICQFLENRIHVVLMGPRRFGKTSFVLNLLKELERKKFLCLYIDIFNITSHRDFLQQFLRTLQSKKPFSHMLKEWWLRMKTLLPQMGASFEPATGGTSFSLTFAKIEEKEVKEAIQDLLESLDKLEKKIVVALDEFQKIAEIEDQGWLEATLRSHFQRLKNVSFLFTGSRKSLIADMLNNPSRPLYRSCQILEFPLFGEEFTDWLLERFKKAQISITSKTIQYLRSSVQDTPNYVQMLSFHLVAKAFSQIGTNEVDAVLEEIAKQNAYSYQAILNSLTLAQQRTLRLAANEGHSIFQKELLGKYEIPSSAALHLSLKALKSKGILDEEVTVKGNVRFDDPLFAFWIKRFF